MSTFVNLNRSEDEIKHRNKIVEEYLLLQNDILKLYYKKYPKKLNITSEYYAVIVEPRSNHKLLEAVCRNVMYFLPSYFNLVIYSYDEKYVSSILPDIEYLFFKTSKSSLNQKEYSQLLMSSEFWNNIPGENIIIFQTDSYLTRELTDDFLNEIKKYPFVGAPYKIDSNRQEDGNILSVFNNSNDFSICGGFSFRSKKAMLDCIHQVTMEIILEDRKKRGLNIDCILLYNEDSYFENALYLLKYPLPNFKLLQLFCTQTLYELVNTLSFHGIHRDYVLHNIIIMLRPPLCDLHNEVLEKIKDVI